MLDILYDDIENKIAEALQELHKQKSILETIEFPFDISELNSKKRLEGEYLRKFLAFNGEKIHVLEFFESPDFILEYNEQNIGLEIERICNPDSQIRNGFWQGILDKAADIFKREHPGINILANVRIDQRQNIKIRQNEKSRIWKIISDMIYEAHIQSIETDRSVSSPIIKNIFIQPHSRVDFVLNEGAYSPINLTQEILKNFISRKESKVQEYINNSSTHKQWLLLRTSNAGTDSYDIRDVDLSNVIQRSNFERIYLMDDFGAKVHRI